MKVVYIASKFTEKMRFRHLRNCIVRILLWLASMVSPEFKNVMFSSEEAFRQMSLGNSPISPIANNASWWKWGYHLSEKAYLKADFELIKRCDEIVFLPNWKSSRGANEELALCRSINIPVKFNNQGGGS